MDKKIIFTNQVGPALDALMADLGNPTAIIVTDNNAREFALPLLLADSTVAAASEVITVRAGDDHKTLDALQEVWTRLSHLNATRQGVVINFGGGMVTDLGGFAASTFKRGMRAINIPTTLLGAVDASVGGKTAVNFNGAKNQIGTFAEPQAVIISTLYLNTLPQQEILSGYAEMLKHGLLDSPAVFNKLLAYSPVYPIFDSERLLPLIEESVMVKKKIVDQDPTETSLRKALNLGHTIGHAFEALALARKSAIPHGYAVAWGMVVELVLSHMQLGFPGDILHKFADYILTNYGAFDITCDDYPALMGYMQQDKKNDTPDAINFTLLADVGSPKINCTASTRDIQAALDIYRDLMKI